MSKTKIAIVQINSSFSGCHYLPYSAGLLEAYARTYCKNIDDYEFLLPIYKRESVQKIVEKIQEADIVAFSSYVWNIRLSLAVAKAIKEINPNVFIIFGGPQVPDKSEEFLRAHTFIDMVVNGEGERVFTHILENFSNRTFEDLRSISYINNDGGFVGKPKIDRIKSLDEIPSPYINGIFDDLMWANPDEQWLVMWETDRGCPFSCCFSDNNYIALSDKIVRFDSEIYERRTIKCNDPTHRHTKCISDDRIVYQGKRECLRIELENGSFIEVTAEHKVKIFDGNKTNLIDSRAENIKVGDYLPIQIGQNSIVYNNSDIDLKSAYSSGHNAKMRSRRGLVATTPRTRFYKNRENCRYYLLGLYDLRFDCHIEDTRYHKFYTQSERLAYEIYNLLSWIGYLSEVHKEGLYYSVAWYINELPKTIYNTNIDNTYACKVVNIIKTDLINVYDIGNPPTYMVTANGIHLYNSFCDWGSAIASKVSQFDIDRLYKEVDWMSEHKIEFIFCCDANFGMLKRAIDIAQYVGTNKEKYGYPKALSVQNAKNATDRVFQVQKILGDYGLNKGVTLSIQSLNKDTLDSIKRGNISSESYASLQKRFAEEQISTYTDLILGMPCETYDSMKCNIAQLVEDGQHNRIQFNNLSILPNAGMGDKDYQKKYGMIIIDSIATSMHNSLSPSEDGVDEWQELVVGTDSCPKEDWVKTRAFCWMVALLYFDKLLQIPICVLRTIADIPYKELFDIFFESDTSKYPILDEIKLLFINKAIDIQNGGPEYCPAPEWLNIYYPADEFVFIKIVKEDKIDRFYQDCESIILDYLKSKGIDTLDRIVSDCVKINKSLMQLPFVNDILCVELSYNIYEYYKSVILQAPILLEETQIRYHINRQKDHRSTWEDWYKYTVWYCNKAGNYMNKNIISEIVKEPEPNIVNLEIYNISGH